MFNAPSKIPESMKQQFTMDSRIQTSDKYYNECYGDRNYYWPVSAIDNFLDLYTVDNLTNGGFKGYDNVMSNNFIKLAEEYIIHDKKIAVIGSQLPWIECLFYNLGNDVTTIRTKPALNSELFKTMKFEEFEEDIQKYDIIISYASAEHAGLGRYGDAVDPQGDIREMRACHKNLKPTGKLLWIGSVGVDHLIWNAKRIYGNIRLTEIFKGFNEIKWLDQSRDICVNTDPGSHKLQLVVLEATSEYNV